MNVKHPIRSRLAAALAYLDGELLKNIEADHGIPANYVAVMVRRMGCPPRRPDLSESATRSRLAKTGTEG